MPAPRTSRPAGPARSALWGRHESPGIGLPLSHGAMLVEDWLRYGSATDLGDLGSTLATIGGGGASLSLSTPTAATELGIARLAVSASRGGQLHLQTTAQVYKPAPGMVWATKIDIPTVTSVEVWAGLSSSTAARVRTADATEFIGVRYIAGTDTWEGVTKTGSGSSETVVDLTSGAHVPGTYAYLGWEAVDTDGAGTLGIQWLTWDTSDRRRSYSTRVGDPVTTTIPTTIGPCLLGAMATTQSARTVLQDYWQLGGRFAR